MRNRQTGRKEFMTLAGAGVASFIGGVSSKSAHAAERTEVDLVVLTRRFTQSINRRPKPSVRRQSRPVCRCRKQCADQVDDRQGHANLRCAADDHRAWVDYHNHAPGATLLYEVIVGNPYVVEFVTISSIVDKLRAKVRDTPPGMCVEGYCFDDTTVKDNLQLNIHYSIRYRWSIR
jgi:hypothetical protein